MQVNTEEKNWAMWCHLSAFAVMLGVPFGSVLGPFIVWQIKRTESAFIDEHGKEAVNFQLSLCIYLIAAGVLMFFFFVGLVGGVVGSRGEPGFVFPFLIGGGMLGPFLALMLFPLLGIIFTIIAALQASNGEMYRYPFTIRFIC